MKAKELMIGDWVLFHDSGWASDGSKWHEDRTCRIIGIGDAPRLEWTDDGEKEEWPHASYVEIEPIPLTDAILEANGFRREGGASYWTKGKNSAVIFYWNQERTELLIGSPSDECMIKLNVRYVHELQHAFRLAGIDKEFILED